MALLRIGSRGSQLALWQANHVAEQLRARGNEVQIEVIKTTGDKITEVTMSRVGTSSLRREAQLRALLPGLRVELLRGNVETRLRKLTEGGFDAIILAAAGLSRLGRQDAIREIIEPRQMCPAAGQGALAIETRSDDRAVLEAIKFLDDADSRAATDCERSLLRTLGGGCQVPIGALAEKSGTRWRLLARVARPDGSQVLTEEGEGDDPLSLGKSIGGKLLRIGAQAILEDVYGSRVAAPQQP